MSENMKKLLELLSSADEALREKVSSMDKDALKALAAEKGISLTDADFESAEEEEGEVSVEEADAVAGGKKCYCVAGGGGTGSGDHDCTCAWVAFGMGAAKYFYSDYGQHGPCFCPRFGNGEENRCACMGYGSGSSQN